MLLVAPRGFRAAALFIAVFANLPRPALSAGAAPLAPHMILKATSQTDVDIPGGAKAQYAFVVKNDGGAALLITAVKPSCGCTVAEYTKEIPPGGTGTISATVQTQPAWTMFSKDLAVSTNDPGRPNVDLELLGKVIPLYTITPASSFAEQYDRPDPITKVFSIQFRPGNPVKFVGAPAVDGPVQAWIDPDPHAANLWIVTVTLTPPPAGGSITGDVQLTPDMPGSQPIHLQVTGVDTRGITYSPRLLVLGALRPGQAERQTINVFSQESTFQVTRVESDDPHLTVEIVPVKMRFSWYNIEVRYAGGWANGIHRGLITVHTDFAAAPTIQIPYAADVR